MLIEHCPVDVLNLVAYEIKLVNRQAARMPPYRNHAEDVATTMLDELHVPPYLLTVYEYWRKQQVLPGKTGKLCSWRV
jgi:hypothetical protein